MTDTNTKLSLTLQDSLKLTGNTLQSGVIQLLTEESPLLQVLPFRSINGSALTYTVQTEVPKTGFRTVGETYKPTETKLDQRTAVLKILGDEAIIDTFQSQVAAPLNDLLAVETELRVKALSHSFEKAFIYGDSETDPNSFDGIAKQIQPNNVITTTGKIADDCDILRDLVNGSDTDEYALIMSKETRRNWIKQDRDILTQSRSEFGQTIESYGDMQVIALEDNFMKPEDKDSIYCVRLSSVDGVSGLENGGVKVTPIRGTDRPIIKNRIEFFCGVAVFDSLAVAKCEAA